jgi:hypothetical protein
MFHINVAICAIQSTNNDQIGIDLMNLEIGDLNKQHEQSKRIMRKTFTEREMNFVELKFSLKDKIEAFYRF